MQTSMFNMPIASRRRKPVEAATAAQLARITGFSQTGDERQQDITKALMLFQRGGGVISRGRAASVLDACSSGHAGSFVVMLLEHHGGNGSKARGAAS